MHRTVGVTFKFPTVLKSLHLYYLILSSKQPLKQTRSFASVPVGTCNNED